MDRAETLGVPAHPGGMLVERPELTVGLVRATSSPTGLEIELIARRPPDRRTATERQADIRAGRDVRAVAPRHLLPAYDEGLELRFARLDEHGRAQWSYPVRSASSSGFSDGRDGPTLRALYRLPATFDAGSFVLAWPEIGFPETVLHLCLPDMATVEHNTIRLWQAPVPLSTVPDPGLAYREDPSPPVVDVERCRTVAAPRLLRRTEHAIVVLTRLTGSDSALSMEIRSAAGGEVAAYIAANEFPHQQHDPVSDPLGARVTVVDGSDAVRLRSLDAGASGGPESFEASSEYVVARPAAGALTVITDWPGAGLPAAQLTIPLDPAAG